MKPKKVTIDFDDFLSLLFAIGYVGDISDDSDLGNFFDMTREEYDCFVDKMHELDTRTSDQKGVVAHPDNF